MKLKKVMALTLAVVMGISMAGCGGGKGSQPAAGSEAKAADRRQLMPNQRQETRMHWPRRW